MDLSISYPTFITFFFVGLGLLCPVKVKTEDSSQNFNIEVEFWKKIKCLYPELSPNAAQAAFGASFPAIHKCQVVKSKSQDEKSVSEIFLSQLCQTLDFVSEASCRVSKGTASAPRGADKSGFENSMRFLDFDACAYSSIFQILNVNNNTHHFDYFIQGCDKHCKSNVEPLCRLTVSVLCRYDSRVCNIPQSRSTVVKSKRPGYKGLVVDEYSYGNSPKESWAYVDVRPKAHMFYWLYYTSHDSGYLERPLIMWLQGGPGASGTGFGNFEELGPLDTDMKPRNTTWLQVASLLFVDNPVGTGYSYVDNDDSFTTDINEITADLLQLIKAFIKNHNDFQKVPFYIFSESYGGKMTAAFSAVLNKAIEGGELFMNFKGLAMGDSWISPVDSVLSWGPYLKATSIISQNGLDAVNNGAKQCQKFVEEGKFAQATNAWSRLEEIVEDVGSNVNFYNIMDFDNEQQSRRMQGKNKTWSSFDKLYNRHVGVMQGGDLDELMNGPIRKKLGIIPNSVKWGGQSTMVFIKQSKDFMKNVTSTVNDLINKSKLKVIVYSGQLDLICDVLGTEAWFSRLDISKKFKDIEKKEYSCGATKPVCFFGSELNNVQFYWVLNAGHMVPADNGPGALAMVKKIVG